MVFENTNWVSARNEKSILEYLTGVGFGIPENLKVSEISETDKISLRTFYKSGNPLGNQKGFPKGFPSWFEFPRERIFLRVHESICHLFCDSC